MYWTWWKPTCSRTTLLYMVTRWIYKRDIRCAGKLQGISSESNSLRCQITVLHVNNKKLQIRQHKMKKERYMQVHHWLSRVYTWVHCIQVVNTYACTFTKWKACIPWKTQCLVQIIWSMVFWSMILVQGIRSEVLTPGIWSKVLVLSGFGTWYWERPKTIKGGEDH